MEARPAKTTRLAELRKLGTLKPRRGRRIRDPKEDRQSKSTQPGVAGDGPGLRRASNVRDMLIEPQQFSIDKILMLLDIKKLKRLGQEFENIIGDDKARQEEENRQAR